MEGYGYEYEHKSVKIEKPMWYFDFFNFLLLCSQIAFRFIMIKPKSMESFLPATQIPQLLCVVIGLYLKYKMENFYRVATVKNTSARASVAFWFYTFVCCACWVSVILYTAISFGPKMSDCVADDGTNSNLPVECADIATYSVAGGFAIVTVPLTIVLWVIFLWILIDVCNHNDNMINKRMVELESSRMKISSNLKKKTAYGK